MRLRTPTRRWLATGGSAAVVLAVTAGMQTAASAAPARLALSSVSPAPLVNPYSPASHLPGRYGIVPAATTLQKMMAWDNAHALNHDKTLRYGGGKLGYGVSTGHPKVYLVFFGKQWGTPHSSHGIVTLTNDPVGAAPYLQKLLKGLGRAGDHWSGVETQYCQTARGSKHCPATARHVAFTTGGVLRGVWVDRSRRSPQWASFSQLASEALRAARHFHNGTSVLHNRDAQYVIFSPHGTDPDHYRQRGFCAYHSISSTAPSRAVTWTNLPYMSDLGRLCYAGVVNSGNRLDGYSVVEGHEFSETMTDQPTTAPIAGGWTVHDRNSRWAGAENGDVCQPDFPGYANLRLPTGRFAMQPTWSNAKRKCEFSGKIIGTDLVRDGGFEAGHGPWSASSGVILHQTRAYPAHTGHHLARLDGRGRRHTDTLSQKVKLAPPGGTYTLASLSFWLRVKSNAPHARARDTLKVEVLSAKGKLLRTLHVYSNRDASAHYQKQSLSLRRYAGKTIIIKFAGQERLLTRNTAFLIDDVALLAS